MATATCSALLIGVLSCNAPAAVPAPLTLHGTPISGTVDVYRLSAPAVVPAVAPDGEQEPSPARSTKRLLWLGALVGGAIGCTSGAYLSMNKNDDAHAFNCLWVAGVGGRTRCGSRRRFGALNTSTIGRRGSR